MNSSGILDPTQWTGQQASQQNQQQLQLVATHQQQLRKTDGIDNLDENGSRKPYNGKNDLRLLKR